MFFLHPAIQVSQEQLWDGLQRSRHDSDTVDQGWTNRCRVPTMFQDLFFFNGQPVGPLFNILGHEWHAELVRSVG